MKLCYACGTAVDAPEGIGRRDACFRCGADLHCCCNCRYYTPGHHNDCVETQAEQVVEKDRGNFCDYFAFVEGPLASRGKRAAGSARTQLDALFRKKT